MEFRMCARKCGSDFSLGSSPVKERQQGSVDLAVDQSVSPLGDEENLPPAHEAKLEMRRQQRQFDDATVGRERVRQDSLLRARSRSGPLDQLS